jgi:hypothetical protein
MRGWGSCLKVTLQTPATKIGGRAEGLAFANSGARTSICVSETYGSLLIFKFSNWFSLSRVQRNQFQIIHFSLMRKYNPISSKVGAKLHLLSVNNDES